MEAFNFKHARFGGAVIAERSALFLISAGAESFISSAGEDDGAYRGVDPGVGEGGEQFIDRTATHRVIAIWAVDGDDGGAIAHLVENVGELGWLKHVDPFAIEAILRGFGDRQKQRSGVLPSQARRGSFRMAMLTSRLLRIWPMVFGSRIPAPLT